MNFKQLEAFYWLAKLGSYQKVAKQINLSQPAVSIRVGSLENELGSPLIHRDQPGVVLTEKGLEVAEFAEEFMHLYDKMNKSLVKRDVGGLVVGLIEPVMFSWGPTFAKALKKRYPDASLRVDSNVALRGMVKEQSVDIVFATAAMDSHPVPQSFVIHAKMGWIAASELDINDTSPLDVAALADLPMVFYPRESTSGAPKIDVISEVRALAKVSHIAANLSTAYQMVLAGFGVAPLVLAPFRTAIEDRSVRVLNTSGALPNMEIRCFYQNAARRRSVREIYALAAEVAQSWCAEHPDYATFLET